jgi:hypothetical protein
MHVITYTRQRDGVFFHGTISDLLDNELADFLRILERKEYFLLDEARRSYVRVKKWCGQRPARGRPNVGGTSGRPTG